jgi:hypothetical protein
MAMDIKKREFQRQKDAEQRAQKEKEELKRIERERKKLFKDRRIYEAQVKAQADAEAAEIKGTP